MAHGLIDSHCHLWDLSQNPQPWIDPDTMPQINRDFRAADLDALLSLSAPPSESRREPDATVLGAVLVQASNSLAETLFLLDESERLATPAAVVGWIDVVGDVPGQLATIMEHDAAHRLTGLRHLAHVDPDPAWLLNPAVAAGVRHASAYGLAIDLVVRAHQIPQAIALAQAVPEAQFVLNHLGNAPLDSGDLGAWTHDFSGLARLPNVAVKLSGLAVTSASDAAATAALSRAFDVALEQFGPARLMFGSDWPLVLLSTAGYQGWVRSFLGAIATLAPQEHAAICVTNAQRIYRMQK